MYSFVCQNILNSNRSNRQPTIGIGNQNSNNSNSSTLHTSTSTSRRSSQFTGRSGNTGSSTIPSISQETTDAYIEEEDALPTNTIVTRTNTLIDIHHPDRSDEKQRLLYQERTLTLDQKKRKIEDVYNSAMWVDPKTYMDDRVRKVVRELIFSRTKFCKNEGVVTNKSKKGKRYAKQTEYGRSHERMDLTVERSYATELMKFCDVTTELYSLTEISLWWKVYNDVVKNEIMQVRGRKGHSSRALIQNSKFNSCCIYI